MKAYFITKARGKTTLYSFSQKSWKLKMVLYLKLDYWGPHVSLDHDCGRGRPTLACFCFLKCNSKKNPQKKNHANFKISCYQTPPPNPMVVVFFQNLQQTSPPAFLVPAQHLGCHVYRYTHVRQQRCHQLMGHRSSVGSTVRRDYRRIKIRLQGIYGGIPKTLVLSGARP